MCRDERNTERRSRPLAALPMRCRVRLTRRVNRILDFSDMAGLLLLAFLAADGFGLVFDAFALIGLGLAIFTNLGGDLPDPLLVRAGDADRRRLLAYDLDVVRDWELDVVAVAELQDQVLPLHLGAIADTVDFEIDGIADRHAVHHVVDQRARRAPLHARLLGVVARANRDTAIGDHGLHLAAQRHVQRAELALGGQPLSGDGDLNAWRNDHRIFSDA